MLKSLHKRTSFSGIWLDMNEPSNMCSGECNWNKEFKDDKPNPIYVRETINLPYHPG